VFRRVSTGRVADHPYVCVAAADRDVAAPPLVILPGLNDPMMRVTATPWYAGLMALLGRRYARRRPVYLVSRPLDGPETVRGLATDYEPVFDELGPVDAMGLSMGGFVLAELAAARPDLVERVAFALAAGALSGHGEERVRRWLDLAERERWRSLFADAFDVVATGWRRVALGVGGRLYDAVAPGPESPLDFRREATACLAYDGRERVRSVDAPALVVGGTTDPFFSEAAFRRTARLLPDGRLALLRGAGHEAPLTTPETFDAPLRAFFQRD
jgi:pimeloyl-ACP methyl ester carboxylesterase